MKTPFSNPFAPSFGTRWTDKAPVREELFGVERLEQHARSLAVAQAVTKTPPRVPTLHARLDDNAAALLAAYRDSARELEQGRAAVPAAEWLLDNYHLVEEQVREARLDLPPGFYRQLPKLESGPFAGYPRVFGIAWAYVAHTDSHFDADVLTRFLAAYQTVQPLTIGELWAIAITLRIVLIENLRRVADQITSARGERDEADGLADRLLGPGDQRTALEADHETRGDAPLNEIFAAQLVKRLRGQDPETTPALAWLARRLAAQDLSIDLVVQHDHQRQAIANVTVRNVITSMRLMSDIGWADLFERVSLVDERLRRSGTFAAMDFPSRNLYRDAIEELARGSGYSEIEIATRSLSAERSAAAKTGAAADGVEAERAADPGYHLIGHGREAFEHALGFVPSLSLRAQRWTIRGGIGGYVTSVLLVTAGVIALASLWFDEALPHTAILTALALIALIPFSDVATALVNRSIALNVGARPLPGLELLDGVPTALRTLIVVPTLLTSRAELREQIEHLEVHHLSGAGGEVHLALLTDWADAATEIVDGDLDLLAFAVAEMAKLNERHAAGEAGPRFLLLHRRRIHSAAQDVWMSWERKRGKLQELNRLLRGATDTTFMSLDGVAPWAPPGVRYVITLDADTRLPRDTATRLIGKMAHPLNRPRFDAHRQRVVDGYGILQPRVTPSLPLGRQGSIYQRVFAGPSGIDPYASAASDVYQDLLGEGSFTGKGIYDVDAFEAALAGRVPEDTLLSHDLFEGSFARAGLASDVEVIDEFPSRYDVDAKRQHRWVRGDWQLLPWIWGHRDGPTTMPMAGRWKMLDNLRRSMIAPTTLAAFGLSAMLPPLLARQCVALLLMVLVTPLAISTISRLWERPKKVSLQNHLSTALEELKLAGLQLALLLVLLPDRAWRSGDAIVRTLVRVLVTRRRLLEWTTAAQSARGRQPGVVGFYRLMAGGTLLVLVYALVALVWEPASAPIVVPLALIWLASPAFAAWVSRPLPAQRAIALSDHDGRQLRLVARRTWRFFETFVTPADHLLPPDNFQEVPRPTVARRTSPTNLGLYLLSTVAARDFGWAGTGRTVERIEATLASMRQLGKFRGHFFNWYDTGDLRVLEPPYVSAVDSGNLAGHLIVLANACESWRGDPVSPETHDGLHDTLRMARDALAPRMASGDVDADARAMTAALDRIEVSLVARAPLADLVDGIDRLIAIDTASTTASTPREPDAGAADVAFWFTALRAAVDEHRADRSSDPHALDARLDAIAREARAVAMAMDFTFLLDGERKLLSIGYSLADNRLDPSCYDLLASEARLASLFAIAKGDVPTNHWFRLGRSATPVGFGSALISWSGSMFEYLMPSLVMRAPYGSLLEQTNRLVVERQRSYAAALGVPWGVSESAYNARDIDFTYQYSNFGVPGLGFKRGLADNLVIAPYATGLATMVDPLAALANFAELAALGGLGRYGYYDALDFTRARVPEGEKVAVVRNYMAHHEGMTLVAIANTLHDGRMRARFHAEPMIVASELLMQERIPRDIAENEARVEELKPVGAAFATDGSGVRRLSAATGGAPVTHLLSNDRYTVMLTTSGSGYSRWGDIAVTRWNEDATRDAAGSFVFLRDVRGGTTWTATNQPLRDPMVGADVTFAEDIATYTRRDGRLLTTLEVVVSGEDDAEVRRVSLHNRGRHAREIELTSYAELVLTSVATDNAHPAFAKMFVQTRHVPAFDALVATRRRRTPDEPEVWAAHFTVIEGRSSAPSQYETDRARFVGRSRHPGIAAALQDGRALSNTAGTVLDPVFALRCRVEVPAGEIVTVSYWTVVASTEDALMDLVDRHHDRNAFDRARTFAWTQAQVKLRHLAVKGDEASDFQRLAAPVLYNDPRFRMPSDTILRGMGAQSGLWAQSISGDLPIVVMRIDDLDDMPQVDQLLRAHEYWRAKGLAADVVVVNERASSYVQDLQIAIETAQRSSQSRPGLGARSARGSLYALRADLLGADTQALLLAVARVVLVARRGPLSQQLVQLLKSSTLLSTRPPSSAPTTAVAAAAAPVGRSAADGLLFFNGTGGFAADGRSYVTILDRSRTTPAPWINVVANARFGFQASADGSGFAWAENSRDNQLTPWSNDAVGDPAGEALYVRDEVTGQVWTATAQPIRDDGVYVARHGFGWSRFEHEVDEIALDLLQYVPLADPLRISRLTLHNRSARTRRLSVTSYGEWVLGTSRNVASPFIATELDATGALLVRNAWGTAFPDRVAFSDLGSGRSGWTADRTEFLGRNGHMAAPAALLGSARLSNSTGAGFDVCTAIQTVVEIAPGARVEVVALLGQCATATEARELIARYRAADLDAVLAEVERHWDDVLGTVQVRTPDAAMNVMLNGWLLYQTLACRIFARSAFYQASGAYGFRDQLQDGMALTFAMPEQTRGHLLRAAGRQFVEGDVQHWWLPHSGQGVRTHISDDRVWLAYATATYIVSTGDGAILDEPVAWLEGPALKPDEHDAFFKPMQSDDTASLFEHCARGLDQCIALTGQHGLPLMGTGDWNDGMNRVGQDGHGESVWLAWLLLKTIDLFAPHAERRDHERLVRWRAHAEAVRASIERVAWDGDWYRRATFDDGTWLGSKSSEECRIDSIAQSWAVLSGAADVTRATTAMASVDRELIRRDDALALLFTPPFDRTHHDPGYIKGYPPGLRENGGQYSHAAMWLIFAFARLGQTDRAVELFGLLNPVNHALTPRAADVYKVEPYVVAADVYSVAPHAGRGGWTWYTGSAAWMYRAGIEGILGITREAGALRVEPRLPAAWPGFEATIRQGASRYTIEVRRGASGERTSGGQPEEAQPEESGREESGLEESGLEDAQLRAQLDGSSLAADGGVLHLPLDGRDHRVVVTVT